MIKPSSEMWCVLGLFLLHTIFYLTDEYASFRACLSDFSLNFLFMSLPFYLVGRYKMNYDKFKQ